MERGRLEDLFSEQRLKPYFAKFNDHHQAIQLYKRNIQLSESFYTTLSVVEIALRNAINNSCKQYFSDEYWFKNVLPEELLARIARVENNIIVQKKIPHNDRIVSELTFGFWTSLFNRRYAALLWKPLHQVFHNMPHHLRQRALISPKLNAIRIFRNRVYHYEPISWSFRALQYQHANILDILNWLDKDLAEWITDIDRLPNLLKNHLPKDFNCKN